MGLLTSSLEEDRFLATYSFIRMVLLMIAGGILNAAVMGIWGFRSTESSFYLASDWRLFLIWVSLYPIVWAVFATYVIPAKLRVSPFDLEVSTTIILAFALISFGDRNWLPLTLYNGFVLIAASIIQSQAVGLITGLGKAGRVPYHYDSFILKSKKVSDFYRCYENEQYRDWIHLPNLELDMKRGTLIPDRAILSSGRDNDLGVFVFLSNHEKGLLVQIISFEKGKYTIFESKEATFWAEQFRRTILWEMGVAKPIDYADEEERNKAERHALRVTQSLAPFRGLLRRDQIVVGIGLILLATDYLLWVLNIGMDHLGFALLTVLGVGSSFPTQDLELCAYGRKSEKVVLHQPLETGSVSSPQFVSKPSQ